MARVEVPEELLTLVETDYDQGRYLDAYQRVLSVGALGAWQGTQARVLGARLAARLGGSRLSTLMIARAWREAPRHALTVLYRAYDLWYLKGPLRVWEFTEAWKSLEDLDVRRAADLLVLRDRIAGEPKLTTGWRHTCPHSSVSFCGRGYTPFAEATPAPSPMAFRGEVAV
jgi:hypothetical protein